MKPQLKMTIKQSFWLIASVVAMAALTASPAFAAGTDADAGDTITNTATINYQVGGTSQPAVNSNAATFVVDHKVRPLAANSADDNAVPNGVDEYLTFTVTNDGNTDADTSATLEIQLTAQQGANGSEDDFDVVANSIRIYVESNPVPDGLQIGTDPLVTDYSTATIGYIDLARDTSATVYLVANMPATPTNGQTALCHLVATAWDSGAGAALAEDGDGDDPNAMEVVWADGTGSLPAGDGDYDGLHSAAATFTIVTATLGVTKTSSVVADPFGGTYRVPRAEVQYLITIANTGAASADNLQIVDTIPGGTNYIVGSEGTSLAGISVEYSDNNQATWTYAPGGPGEDGAITDVRFTLTGSVAAAGNETVQFNVFIE